MTNTIETVEMGGELWFKIHDHQTMRPFLMNVVSDSNHWMFISSNGGLTAGRKKSKFSLFPYYTDDKLSDLAEVTGSKTMIKVEVDGNVKVWEPFSEHCKGSSNIRRNLYKTLSGNKVLFEEVNLDLGLTFRYQWCTSETYGFVRKSELVNSSGRPCQISVLDGIQNVLPYGVDPDTQNTTSNLVDAYKRTELIDESWLGIFALSAIIVDKTEPSEALKANAVWSIGLNRKATLLSSLQLNAFRSGLDVAPEHDIKGEKGAYFVVADIDMNPGAQKSWKTVANVNLNHTQIVALNDAIINRKTLDFDIETDIDRGTMNLVKLVAAADGLRFTSDTLKDSRHYSNVLFNIMRGGIFDDNYSIEKSDLLGYLAKANKDVFERNHDLLQALPATFKLNHLNEIDSSGDIDLYRLCTEYLPLKFSRRHGDPSRPWNQFSINTHNELDGSKVLDYEGNWRDIFQNWEALVHSYPAFIDGMIFKFLNASTFDGYNPYRVTKDGFDWEVIEHDNPWSYIGYWGDHQIIYLQKFLEFYQSHHPGGFGDLFKDDSFVYANVPYRIKSYDDIASDPKNTIDFIDDQDRDIRAAMAAIGSDGALVNNAQSGIHHVNFVEKLLATVLAKVSNFIPEAGIWMNTQRPEWNDANNALVGNGVSMVTLYYLRRFLSFWDDVLQKSDFDQASVSAELHVCFSQIADILESNKDVLSGPISDERRKSITDALGNAGSDYRTGIYDKGFSGDKVQMSSDQMIRFIKTTLAYLEHSIDANRRADHLFHAYNIMSFEGDGITIGHLDEILEGQVAVLSSGYLSPAEAADLLDALRASKLYRADQNSYILYPNKQLPRFLEKNNISKSAVDSSKLLTRMAENGDRRIISRDINGGYHFNGNFRNAADLRKGLESIQDPALIGLVKDETSLILRIFEDIFNHKAFTGRSGTFFAYEGLGSIYWHMVSKLHLAVMEVCQHAILTGTDQEIVDRLMSHFHEIGEGIGIHKSPQHYGAFPTDPYSHTPQHRGAQQPGMTGQVKEDILVSLGELGIEVIDGCIRFNPILLSKSAFTAQARTVQFIDINQVHQAIDLEVESLAFSFCQTPIVYKLSDRDRVEVFDQNGGADVVQGLALGEQHSRAILDRTGDIKSVVVYLDQANLR